MFQWFQKLTKQKNILIIFTISVLLVGVFTVVQPAAAAPWRLVPECADRAVKLGGCDVCDAIGVGINITKIMLGTLGSAALLMFVYGGVLMGISRGHADQVTKGKDALMNAVKGVIIVLGSWVVINYGLAIMLGPSTSLSAVKLFPGSTGAKPWYQVACGSNSSSSSSASVSCGADADIYPTNQCSSLCKKSDGTNVADQTACGYNAVCKTGICLTKCEYSFAASGYKCVDSQIGQANCTSNLCPKKDDDNFRCCK